MLFNPITYNEPVFRPPGEANSVIVQATLGCSWNACAFCEMYTSKQFKARKTEDVLNDIKTLSQYYSGARKLFLADGNAFVLSANKLKPILNEINACFGRIQRVSSYALPKDILNKTDAELHELKALGLKLLYIGIETGDNALLQAIHKGETYNSMLDGILKAQHAGIDTSVMILNGLGGKKYWEQHAVNSAKIINQINPKFLSTLTLSLPYGQGHFKQRFKGKYIQQSMVDLFEELKLFIENLDITNTIYRSDHVSNNLILKGILSKDREKLMHAISEAINTTPLDLYPTTSGIL